MPRVPVYERQQVATAPLPDSRMTAVPSPDALGAGLGAGLQRAGDVAAQMYRDEKRKADQVVLLDADRQLGDWEAGAIYDPQAGALQKRGKDAFGLPDQVLGEYDKAVGKIETGLSGDEQRQAFRRAAIARRQDIERTVQRHVAGEIRRYDDDSTKAYLANSLEAAAFNFRDADRVELEIGRQRAVVMDHARRNGLPVEWVRQQVTELTSKTHVAVINRMLSDPASGDLAAKAYYEKHKADVAGDDAGRVDAVLAEGSLRGESQRQAAVIVGRHETLAAALEAVKGIEDPKVQDATRDRVRQEFQLREQAKRERADEVFLRWSNWLESGRGELSLLRGTKPDEWVNQMTPSHRQALEQRARQVRDGVEPVTDDALFVKLTNPQRLSDLAAMSEAELLSHRPKLDNQAWGYVHRMWQSARSDRPGDQTATLTFKDVLSNVMRNAGIMPAGKSANTLDKKDDIRRVSEFMLEAAVAVEQFEGGKRKATQEEMQNVIVKLAMQKHAKVRVDVPWGWDRLKEIGALTGDERNRAYVPLKSIPPADLKDMRRAASVLNNGTTSISDSQLQKAYAMYLMGDEVGYRDALTVTGAPALPSWVPVGNEAMHRAMVTGRGSDATD